MQVTPERAYRLTASKTNYQTINVETPVLAVGEEEDIPLPMTYVSSSVSGRVRFQGNPVTGANVVAEGDQGTESVTTNEEGRYSLSLQPDEYQFTVSQPGYHTVSDLVEVAPGENLTGVNWSMQSNFATVSGRITDTDGTGLSGVAIEATRGEGGSYLRTSDADGYYTFSRLIGGTYDLEVTVQGHTGQTREIGLILDGATVTGEDFALVPQTSGFTGIVQTDVGGQPVSGATVRATAENGTRYTTTSGDDGTFALTAIPHGDYSLIAQKAGYTGISLGDQTLLPGRQAM